MDNLVEHFGETRPLVDRRLLAGAGRAYPIARLDLFADLSHRAPSVFELIFEASTMSS